MSGAGGSATITTMPTPFTHLVAAERLLNDPALDAAHHELLSANRGAFLLGNVAPDAHVFGQLRVSSHFYDCTLEAMPGACQVMLTEFPELREVQNPAQLAFIAGYMAHLAVDVVFCEQLIRPHLIAYRHTPEHPQARRRWNYMLTWLDTRDYSRLSHGVGTLLYATTPDHWLPFMPDKALAGWRDLIAAQCPPDGCNRSFEILGARINLSPAELEAVVRSPERMQQDVWPFITPGELQATEATMYNQMRADVVHYLNRQM